MSIGNGKRIRHLVAWRPVMTVLCVYCVSAIITGSLAQPMGQSDYAERWRRLNQSTDGLIASQVQSVVQLSERLNDLEQFLHEHPRALREYKNLLTTLPDDPEGGNWGIVYYWHAAPRRILLDAWSSALHEGGNLREPLVNLMAEGDPRASDIPIADVLESGSFVGELPEPDYRLYKEHLREHSVEEAAPLIEYMLRTNPLLAMDALIDVYPSQLPDAEAIFDDHWTIKKTEWKYEHAMHRGEAPQEAIAALNRLSRHDVWWVRLYALSVTAERGPFQLRWDRPRDLRNDPNGAVKRAVNAINPPK